MDKVHAPVGARMPNEKVLHAVVRDNKILCSGESTCEITYSEGGTRVIGKPDLVIVDGPEITCPKCVRLLGETEKSELQTGGFVIS